MNYVTKEEFDAICAHQDARVREIERLKLMLARAVYLSEKVVLKRKIKELQTALVT